MRMFSMPIVTCGGGGVERLFALPAGADVRFVRVGDVGTFTNLLSEGVPAGCIVSARLDDEVRAMVTRVQLAVPYAHLVVGGVEAERVHARPSMAGDRTALVCPLPDPEAVSFLGRRAWFGARIELLRRLCDARALHWLVRRAIHTVMLERFGLSDASARRRLRPVRNVRELSARCGASEKTLRRYCREHGVVIRKFVSDWKAMLAVWARLLEGRRRLPAWEQVARCLGYRDESGVRKLLIRRLDHRAALSSLCLGDLEGLLEGLEVSLGEGP